MKLVVTFYTDSDFRKSEFSKNMGLHRGDLYENLREIAEQAEAILEGWA